MKFDAFVKSPITSFLVIPAKAGIQENKHFWTPAFAGVTALTTFCEAIKFVAHAKDRKKHPIHGSIPHHERKIRRFQPIPSVRPEVSKGERDFTMPSVC
jgi:hypothetical protein